MNDRAVLWNAAAEVAARAEPAALATVSRKRGSLPLADDAKMLVTAAGERWGTVGGGCVEADVARQALETLDTGAPRIVRHTLNADIAGDLGLSCGGTVELFLEPLVGSPPLVELCRAVSASISRRERVTVHTALQWTAGPRKFARAGNGDAWTVGQWDVFPGDCNQAVAFIDDQSSVFVEPIPRIPRVLVFGAGHVGAEIAKVAAGAGFHVIVVDERVQFANQDRIPWAAEVLAEDFNRALDRIVFEEDDFVIAATRGHAMDATVVQRTAGSRAGYVGMLGSRRKWSVVRRALEQAGVGAAALDRVRCPIGENIGADTPAEIAVSVVAELIRVRRIGRAAP